MDTKQGVITDEERIKFRDGLMKLLKSVYPDKHFGVIVLTVSLQPDEAFSEIMSSLPSEATTQIMSNMVRHLESNDNAALRPVPSVLGKSH